MTSSITEHPLLSYEDKNDLEKNPEPSFRKKCPVTSGLMTVAILLQFHIPTVSVFLLGICILIDSTIFFSELLVGIAIILIAMIITFLVFIVYYITACLTCFRKALLALVCFNLIFSLPSLFYTFFYQRCYGLPSLDYCALTFIRLLIPTVLYLILLFWGQKELLNEQTPGISIPNRPPKFSKWKKRPLLSSLIWFIVTLLFTGGSFGFYGRILYVREEARYMECTCKIKQMALALAIYRDKNNGLLPPVCSVDAQGKRLHSWRVLILPELEAEDLYNKIRLSEPWDSDWNRQFHNAPQASQLFSCPTSQAGGSSLCSYSIITGRNTLFPGTHPFLYNPPKNNKNAPVILVERKTPICWMDPNDEIDVQTALSGINVLSNGVGSCHYKRCHIALADTSIMSLENSFDQKQWEEMVKIDED